MTLRSVFSAVTRRRPVGDCERSGVAARRGGFFLEPCGIVEAVELRAGWNGFPGRFEPAVWTEL